MLSFDYFQRIYHYFFPTFSYFRNDQDGKYLNFTYCGESCYQGTGSDLKMINLTFFSKSNSL